MSSAGQRMTASLRAALVSATCYSSLGEWFTSRNTSAESTMVLKLLHCIYSSAQSQQCLHVDCHVACRLTLRRPPMPVQAALGEGTQKITQTSQVNAVNVCVSRYCPKCQQISHRLSRVTLFSRKVKRWVSFFFYFCSSFLSTSSFLNSNFATSSHSSFAWVTSTARRLR